ncbi:MAG: NADPH-dependent F420 reductase [Anaerolineae bacterium]
MIDNVQRPTIAVLGGTGKEGRGLAYRWARAGYNVLLGSRSPEKAAQTAAELNALLGGNASVTGLSNNEAAAQAQVAVLTVPYAAHAETLESVKTSLAGKMLIDVVVPLQTPKTKVQMPPAGSAAQEAKTILGEGTEVAAAFHTIPHDALLGNESIECEVLVTGSGKQTRAEALKLVEAAGLVGWDAGPIENSVVVEGFASVLIYINKQHETTHAGIRITGVARR